MKKLKLFSSVLFLSACLTACHTGGTVDPQPDILDDVKVEKTKMNYTYSDVMNNFYKASNAIPNQGEPEILVIPLYFLDSYSFIPENKKDLVKEDINKCFNGAKEDVGFESVTSYYSTLSCGKCNLKCKVADWMTFDASYEEYVRDERETITLAQTVVEQYFTTSGEDRKKYDTDNNGYLDGVVIIYAAPDADAIANQNYSNLWAYTNWTELAADKTNPNVCNFFWASYDFMYSAPTALSKLGNRYGSGDGSNDKLILDTHVYIHEMGHMFGLSDYYDYSYQYSPAGGFSMQDYNIASHDPFSCMSLGWCDPYIPTESCTIKLNTFQSSRDVILLTNSWNAINSPFDEYLLIEFYSPDGLNKFDHENQYFASDRKQRRPIGPNKVGIRLWHVDARLLSAPSLRDPSKITCDPNATGKVMHAMSNTYYGNSYGRGYTTVLGREYGNFNILQLIRNDPTETYESSTKLDDLCLFHDGDTFTMNTFGRQFVNKARLNDSNKVLGWSFTVKIDGEKAEIALTRRM